MKKVLIVPVLAAVLLAAACSDPTTLGPTANVRFLNATTGMTGSGGFTANGQFVTGSALAFGQSTQTCPRVNADSTSFGFGAANTGGTGLSGNALATLNNQSVTEGSSYIVAATGSATSPQLFMLDNAYPDSLASNQAAVRFVNFGPGTETTANTYAVFRGAIGTTLIANNIAVGAPTAFSTAPSGFNQFSLVKMPGHVVAVEGSAGSLNLQGGSVNTIAIVQDAAGGVQLVNLRSC